MKAQAEKEPQQAAPKKLRTRPFQFFALVQHRQINPETQRVAEPEVLEFPDKATLRAALAEPAYENTSVRILRGYELKVSSKRAISIH